MSKSEKEDSNASDTAPNSHTKEPSIAQSITSRLRALSNTRRKSITASERRSSIFNSDAKLAGPNILTYNAETERALTLDSKKLNSLQKATFECDLKKVKKIANEANRDIDKLDTEYNVTSLYLAASMGLIEIMNVFLNHEKKAANPNLQCGKYNRTALIQVSNQSYA